MMQNGKEADRLLTVPPAYITLATTSVFTTKGGQVQATNCYCISFCSLLPCTPVLSSGPSADITYLGTKRGQAEISHLCMLTKLFGLPACSAYSLHPHVLRSQQFVYLSLTLGQQNGHFLCICVFVYLCP